MNNRKMNLDRPKISSEEIRSRQNFDQILGNLKVLHKPFYKKTWFWGTTGLATVAVAIGLTAFVNNKTSIDENNSTLASTTATAPLSATENLADTPCINPPVAGQDVPYEYFSVMPGVDTTLVTANGSEISFQESTLLGADVSKPVEIKVRYFADKASAFVAGIPMTVEEGAFESAGMIEIRGEQDGKIVDINPKAPIAVNMQMYKPSEGFNFYYLNEEEGAWEDSECVYSDKDAKLAQSESQDVAPANHSSSSEIIERTPEAIDKRIVEIDEEIELLERKAPKREDYKLVKNRGLVFDLDYDETEFPELKKLKGVGFEALPNQKQYADIVKENWDDVKLELLKDGKYKITFIKRGKTNYLIARPVLSGADEKAAEKLFNEVMQDVKDRKEELEQERKELEEDKAALQAKMEKLVKEERQRLIAEQERIERLQAQQAQASKVTMVMGQAVASFNAFKWGTYNCDSPRQFPNPAPMALRYLNGPKDFNPKTAYVFSFKKEARFTYNYFSQGIDNLNQIGFHSGENVLFVMNDLNQIAYVKFNEKDLKDKLEHNFILTLIEPEDFTAQNVKEILGEKTRPVNDLALR